MFSLFGALLIVYGLASATSIYQRSLGININLYWGAVLLVFGLVMLFLGRRGNAKGQPAQGQEDMGPAERNPMRGGH
jgi:hypothetical protein